MVVGEREKVVSLEKYRISRNTGGDGQPVVEIRLASDGRALYRMSELTGKQSMETLVACYIVAWELLQNVMEAIA